MDEISAYKAGMTPVVPTLIEFLLDETGSMEVYLQQTIDGFKNFIDEQRLIKNECLFTLTKFDTRGLRTPYNDLDIGMVPYLNANTYNPTSATNLNDAIIERIEYRDRLLSNWDIKPRILFVCMTDGMDNSSRFRTSQVNEKIKLYTDREWTFVYLGAFPYARQAALNLGFIDGNIKCFDGIEIQKTMQELSAATTAYRTSEQYSTTLYR